MNSFSAEFRKTITSQIGRDLYLEIERASWNAMPPVAIADLSVAIGTSVGLVRSRNEDRVAVAQISAADGEAYFVVLVCDGVGGTDMGDVAASIALTVFLEELAHNRSSVPLSILLPRLVRRVDDRVRESLRGKGATTLSVLIATGYGEMAATNVGDSRIYAWSPLKDRLVQISRDDTMENELSELAIKDPSALRFRGFGGSLSQAIGEESRTASDLRITLLDPDHLNDGVVVATDGAWKGAEEGFNALLKKAPSATAAVSRVISLSNWTGGIDNASIVVIEKIKDAISNIPRAESGLLKIQAWIGNTKVILSASASASRLPDSERPIMKSDIRKALRKKYVRSGVEEHKKPEQLDFKIVEEPALERKKVARAKIEISVDPEPSTDPKD
ncbi:PP2C family serine/threonine-protein phosphatase [Pseudomonas sp. Marseille-Q1929]|uniref:PP2C family protein-serine/threonine phosphatase n=1 Tax=Pseudomonas sp. Marseille-Q1929 TaxID=2730402 RepID=UPI001A8F9CE3|nr:PP2C family serine/threonine-protein phosphatase [Pseudomonas sp. Marseille-Q1929]MBO0494506.1 serine/threonine-protein phosphatase [Pseudomonas sp. Marseille-Q1929]